MKLNIYFELIKIKVFQAMLKNRDYATRRIFVIDDINSTVCQV